MLRRIAFVLAAMLLSGCSGAERAARPLDQAGLGALQPPTALLRQVSAEPGLRELDGAQFESAAGHSNVTANGTALDFAPAPSGSDLQALTYALFTFDLSDYTGPAELGLKWAGGSAPTGLWVGCANFTANRWDWQPGPSGELLELPSGTDYLSPSSQALVALVYLGNQPCSLEQAWFGDFPVEAPTAVTATATTSEPLSVEVTWQPPASGPAPDSYAIWRSESPAGPFSKLGEVNDLNYLDTAVQSNSDYWYRLTAQLTGTGNSRFAATHCSVGSIWHTGTVFGPFADTEIYDPYNDICITEAQGHPLVAVGATATDGSYGSVLQVYEAADDYGGSWLPQRDTLGHPCYPAVQRLTVVGSSLHWLMAGMAGSPGEYWAAQDSAATQWNAPVEHTSQGSNADMWFLADAGTPLAYSAQAHADWQIMYQQAPDLQGSAWGTAVHIQQDIKSLKESLSNLIMLGGVPTIFYAQSDNVNHTNEKVMQLQQVSGASWTSSEAFDVDPDPQFEVDRIWAVVVQGEPALFYYYLSLTSGVHELRYTRRSGGSWSAPITLADIGEGVQGWQRPMSAAVIDDKPAVACHLATSNGQTGLIYREAADSLGTSWSDPVLIADVNTEGIGLVTLTAVGNPQRPAIAWARSSNTVGFASRY